MTQASGRPATSPGDHRSRPAPLEVILCDIDGCLTGGEAKLVDCEGLQVIADYNRRNRAGEPVPALTLCTGRPSPYVELMVQLIDGHLPCIYEHGCALYDPMGYRFERNTAISRETDGLIRAIREQIDKRLVRTGKAFLQPGKEHSLSVYPMPGYDSGKLAQEVDQILGDVPGLHTLTSVSCTEILPVGINKGTGVRTFSQRTGIPLENLAGIGDSPSDQPFLDVVSFSAAPANGVPDLHVDFRASAPFLSGVLEIIHRIIELNRQRL